MTTGEPQTSFRPRSAYLGHLVVGSGDGAVLIEPSVAGELRVAAALAGPRASAGLLYGQGHHDDEGGYTLVDGFVPAESPELAPVDADPAVALSRLRAEAARNFPGASEVGWWRSAPGAGETGPGWPDPGAWPLGERPDGIGLVVFADGTPPAAATPVPHAVVQGSVVDAPPAGPAPVPVRPDPLTPTATSTSVLPARSRPTRGRNGPPVRSPQLVNSHELRSRRREEPRERGRGIELEAQQWVLLAMIVLVLVIVISVAVMVSRVF